MSEQLEYLKILDRNISANIKKALNFVKEARVEQQILRDIIKKVTNHKKPVQKTKRS